MDIKASLTLLAAAVLLIALAAPTLALTVSHPSGTYENAITVSVSVPDGHIARYALGGGDPAGGEVVSGDIHIDRPSDTPSEAALNTDVTVYPFDPPPSTEKAAVLRVAAFDGSGNRVAEERRTYFIGWDEGDFTVPVVNVIVDPHHLTDYDDGILVKGAIFDAHQQANPGANTRDPFHPANWNAEDERFEPVAYYELFDDGTRQVGDIVYFYISGRWSAAMPQKGFKIKHDDDSGGLDESEYPFFGEESLPYTAKIRFRAGSQDADSGVLMRDAVAARIFRPTEQVVMNARPMELFINGEHWGAYNLREDVDDDYLAAKFSIDNDDIVMLEKDGIVDEGEDEDNDPYFALHDWLETHDLSDEENFAYFESQVNVDGLIDFYTCHMFAVNHDFPNDYYTWKNKNPDSAVPGTMIDGRWQFFCKDLDQSFGLYNPNDYDRDTIAEFLGDDYDDWSTLYLRKAWENEGFRERFVTRSEELLDTTLSKERLSAVVEEYRAEKEPTIQGNVDRWDRPSSVGAWNDKVDLMERWLLNRHDQYSAHIAALDVDVPSNGPDEPENPQDPVDPEGPLDPEDPVACAQSVADLPVTCTGGIIFEDSGTGCRKVLCVSGGNSVQALACDKQGGYEVYRQATTGGSPGIEVCFGDACVGDYGFRKADLPYCAEEPEVPADPEETEEPEEPDDPADPEEPGSDEPPIPDEPPVCAERVADMPVTCEGGSLTGDIVKGSCRSITCSGPAGSARALACDKDDGFEMYGQQEAPGVDVCVGGTCLDGWGFRRGSYTCSEEPMCPAVIDPVCGADGRTYSNACVAQSAGTTVEHEGACEEDPQPDERSVEVRIAPWYPQGNAYVFVCDAQGFAASTYDWRFSDGNKQLGSTRNDIFHVFPGGDQSVECVARGEGEEISSSLSFTVS